MSISTLDGVIAGMQPLRVFAKTTSATTIIGRPQSYWGVAGAPGAGSFDTTLAGVALSSSSTIPNGAVPHTDPGSGNAYLARLSGVIGNTSSGGALMLCDRLWHNGGITITSTSAQTVTSAAFPARDINGSTNGEGVMLAVEVSAATGAGTPSFTVSYTNSAGVSGRTATNQNATTASAVIGATYLLGLQAGDTGVRSVQSITLSATWTSGTINLVAYRLLAMLELATGGVGNAIDALTGGMPRLYNGVVPYFMLVPAVAAAVSITGSYAETQG